MAIVKTSFTVTGSETIVGAIHCMAAAIDDAGFYGAEFDYNEGDTVLEASVDNLDLEGLLGWISIFQNLLKENGENSFSFSVEGIADFDYGYFTAFRMECTKNMISKKEKDFEIAMYEDSAEDLDIRQEEMWNAEEEAMKGLDAVSEEVVVDAEYDKDEYEAANEALAEHF